MCIAVIFFHIPQTGVVYIGDLYLYVKYHARRNVIPGANLGQNYIKCFHLHDK